MMTDQTIEFHCAECPYMAIGKNDMLAHVRKDHKKYNATEREIFVSHWLEDAYVEQQEALDDYYADRKLDKAIHADAFPNK